MSADSHLDKIKKLLRLSKSANPHEAELAMARAMELAAKHAVDVSALHDDPEIGEIAGRWFPMPSRLAREWKMALSIAKQFFHVTPCVSPHKKQVLLIGRPDAVEVADYIISFLVRECRRQVGEFGKREKQQRRRMTGGKRAGFVSGFFFAISAKLEAGMMDLMRHNTELALVIHNEKEQREAKLNELIGKTKSVAVPKARMGAATMAGWHAGQNTNLSRPLTGPSPNNPALNQGTLLLT